MASALETAIANYRRQLLALDATAIRRLVTAYAPIREQLVASIDALVAELSAAGPITPSQAHRLTRLQTLLTQVETELTRLAGGAHQLTLAGQRATVALAGEHALGLAAVQTGSPAGAARLVTQWTRLPTGALESLVGRMQDGSSLARYFQDLPTTTANAIERALLDGVAHGRNPNEVARRLKAQTNIAGEKLITVARNEMLGSYRSATLANYAENDDIVESWVWISALSDRTCPACLALHGQTFPLTETFQKTHSRCRCTSAARLKGFPNDHAGAGERWFASQSAATQDRILRVHDGGKAYRDGDVTLEDFVVLKRDERWGDSYEAARSLDAAKANAASRGRRAA